MAVEITAAKQSKSSAADKASQPPAAEKPWTLRSIAGGSSRADDAPQSRSRAETGPVDVFEDSRGQASIELVSVAGALVGILAELGVERAYGIGGGALVPIADALASSSIRTIHCRHETGAGFAALEDSLASGRPTLVFTTTGPGITNALTGLMAARWEGAKVVFVSAATSARQTGRHAFQESNSHTLPSGLYTAGPLFHYVETVGDPCQLGQVAARLRRGLASPGGFVAHVSVPTDVQKAEVAFERGLDRGGVRGMGCDPLVLDEVAERLREFSTAIWVGFGARGAAPQIRELAERLGAAVMCSPRGKGVFPESHPQFIGVTGFAGHHHVKDWLAEHAPEQILVLGTRLGEFTSFWDTKLVPPQGFIHVDVDPERTGTAFTGARTLGVQAEISALVEGLLARLVDDSSTTPVMPGHGYVAPPMLLPLEGRPVRPQFLMQAIQRRLVERGATIMTEAGNAFAWGNHYLQFDEPRRYRVSTGFGSMGHAVTGVLGAALADPDHKAVAVAGDGSMLMNSEVSTAVQYRIPAVWIVLNDSQYGMIDHGTRHAGYQPVETSIPFTDFVAIARAMGADGVHVGSELDVEQALDRALAAKGPFVVDVWIDPDQRAPFLDRVSSLFDTAAAPKA
ncbi:thiamine pyrophosphate-dependent enzyme [Nannocystaceae bacterium ST9]